MCVCVERTDVSLYCSVTLLREKESERERLTFLYTHSVFVMMLRLLPFPLLLRLLLNVLLTTSVVKGQKPSPPKAIVLFLIDDLGWANVP